MFRKYTALSAVAALIVAAASSVMATPVLPDEPGFYAWEPEEGDSWKYGFTYKPNWSEGLSHYQARIIPLGSPDQKFKAPAFSGVPGWGSGTLLPGDLILYEAGPTTNCNHQYIKLQFEHGKFYDYSIPYPWINSPPFLLQMQAYYDHPTLGMVRRHNQEFWFDGTNFQTGWCGEAAMGQPSGYNESSTGVGEWTLNRPIPEPGTVLLLGSGLLGLAGYGRARFGRKKKGQA